MTFCAGAGEGSRSNAAARATATAKAGDLRIILISLICHREPCATLDAGRGDLFTLSSRAPKGRGDLLARRLLRAFGPRNDKLAGCPKAFLCVASFPASAAASPPSQRESQTRCSPPAST